MPKLSQETKNSIRAHLQKNLSIRAISKLLKVPKSTVHKCSIEMGLKSSNRAGRKKLLSTHDVTFAVTQLSSNKANTVEKLSKTLSETKGIKISRHTLQRASQRRDASNDQKEETSHFAEKSKRAPCLCKITQRLDRGRLETSCLLG